ncbi:MAG: hypothetical protein QNL43_04775 [Crocinitomicaceae bacterium]|jgi:hypothetical protein|tara:strand:- start:15326 stop:15808 length:483 start_codon:yes stop_codon:yes gene_type:complete
MSKKKNILDHIKPAKTTVPSSDFFAGLAAKITHEYPKEKPSERSIRRRLFYFAYAAAAILVIGFIVFQDFNVPVRIENSLESNLAQVSNAEIINYIDRHIENYSSEEIIEFASVVLEGEVDLIADENFLPNDIQFTDIEKYISEEEINLYEFYEDELLIF